MIGGCDYLLTVPAGRDTFGRILNVFRRRWPGGAFQDADEDEAVSFASPALAGRPASREFFVWDDPSLAARWDELGPCPETWNRMVHVLIGETEGGPGESVSVTVVVDEMTPDADALVAELRSALNGPPAGAVNGAVAEHASPPAETGGP